MVMRGCEAIAGLLLFLVLSAYGSAEQRVTPKASDAGIFYVAPHGSDANSGTVGAPWATLNHAASLLRAGQTVYVREGLYAVTEQIRPKRSGTANAWITYAAYPGEEPVIDASDVPVGAPGSDWPWPHDQGAFNIEGVHYIRVHGLTLQNSHAAGFMVRDSTHVELINNATNTTFSSGIAAWDSDHNGEGCEHVKILGNTVTKANTWDMAPSWSDRKGEPPHEAISVAGVRHFEVAYNHVYGCDKEGIDVKETSRHGRVHHNYVHDMARQGLYVDSWFGVLRDVELDHNVVYACRGAGIAVSVEGGKAARDIRIHHNLVYDNLGTGILFARWGGDGLRSGVSVYNNTIHHNGYGPPSPSTFFHWITGGLYLFSANLERVTIRDNILSDNEGFQIGYSDHYLEVGAPPADVFANKQIIISNNLIHGVNDLSSPIRAGWEPSNIADVYASEGDNAILARPPFAAPIEGDFRLVTDLASDVGAFPRGTAASFWWKSGFPPEFSLENQ